MGFYDEEHITAIGRHLAPMLAAEVCDQATADQISKHVTDYHTAKQAAVNITDKLSALGVAVAAGIDVTENSIYEAARAVPSEIAVKAVADAVAAQAAGNAWELFAALLPKVAETLNDNFATVREQVEPLAPIIRSLGGADDAINSGQVETWQRFNALAEIHEAGVAWLGQLRRDRLVAVPNRPGGEGWHWSFQHTVPDSYGRAPEHVQRLMRIERVAYVPADQAEAEGWLIKSQQDAEAYV